MKYYGTKTEGRGLVIYQSLADQLQGYARSDHTHTNFNNLTIGNRLSFGDFGLQYDGGEYPSLAWTHSETGNIMTARKFFVDFWKNFDIHGNTMKGLPTPTADDHATNKEYVDGKINTVLEGIPGALGAAGFISQQEADERYLRTEHTHVSSDISDSITRIGTSESANKLVKTDSSGFLEIIHPNDSSPEKSIITKKYFDEKVGALESEIATLKREIATLKENAGKVKNDRTNRYLDVWVGPEAIKPDSTNKLVFVEKE